MEESKCVPKFCKVLHSKRARHQHRQNRSYGCCVLGHQVSRPSCEASRVLREAIRGRAVRTERAVRIAARAQLPRCELRSSGPCEPSVLRVACVLRKPWKLKPSMLREAETLRAVSRRCKPSEGDELRVCCKPISAASLCAIRATKPLRAFMIVWAVRAGLPASPPTAVCCAHNSTAALP